jgi:hypothetical protein
MPATVADISKLKESIRQSFRKACLKRLEGQEADAIRILQEELPPKVREWKSVDENASGSIETLLADELARTESAHWVVRELEARQSLLVAKLELDLNALREKLSDGSRQAITVHEAHVLHGRTSQEISERLRSGLLEAFSSHTGNLQELPSKAELDLQIDQVRAGIKNGADGIVGKIATTEVIEELLRENVEPLETRIGARVESASVRVVSEIADKLQIAVANALESNKGALKDLPSKAELDQQIEKVRGGVQGAIEGIVARVVTTEIVEELLRARLLELSDKITRTVADESTVLRQGYTDAVARLGQLFAEELSGYEAREIRKWADRQSVWTRLQESSIKKSDLDAALWQAQNSIGDRIEGQLHSVDGLSAEVKNILEEKLQKLVTAEAFEERLMTSSTMLHDALSKSQQEAMGSLQGLLERRLTDATAQIYQRVSSLVSFADWERITRETNAKLSKEMASCISEGVGKIGEESARIIERLEASQSGRAQATMVQLQAIREAIDKQDKGSLQVSLLENLRAFSERIATMMIETSARQEQAAAAFQKDQTDAQTQTLGMLLSQQQNFLAAQEAVNGQIRKTLEEICARQASLENDLRSISASIDNRMRDQLHLHQAEMKALGHKLEEELSQAVGKRLKNMKITTE